MSAEPWSPPWRGPEEWAEAALEPEEEEPRGKSEPGEGEGDADKGNQTDRKEEGSHCAQSW